MIKLVGAVDDPFSMSVDVTFRISGQLLEAFSSGDERAALEFVIAVGNALDELRCVLGKSYTYRTPNSRYPYPGKLYP